MLRRITSLFLTGTLCLATLTVLPANAASSANNSLSVSTVTQKIPAGTMLRLTFQTPVDSNRSIVGQPFMATIDEDVYLQQHLVLPKGSVVRGYVNTLQKPRFFSKGGSMTLSFDHVTSPTGDILPVDLVLSPHNSMVRHLSTAPGGIYAPRTPVLYSDPGMGAKLGKSVDRGTNVFNRLTQKGIDAGRSMAGGLGLLVTVPATAVGGVVAGSAVTTGKAAQAIVGRGESVTLNSGDVLIVDFGGAMDVPVD